MIGYAEGVGIYRKRVGNASTGRHKASVGNVEIRYFVRFAILVQNRSFWVISESTTTGL